jgi:N-acetylmuramoyl-L-alanine amidase
VFKVCQSLAGVLAAVWLAGCAASSSSTTHWSHVPGTSSSPASPASRPPPAPEGEAVAAPPVPPVAEVPGAAPELLAQGFHASWIPLGTWSKACHWNSLRYEGESTNLTCRVQTPMGEVQLHGGSQLASFGGTSYWLGYAPVSADGEVLIHRLDALKNLQPLDREPSGFPPPSGTVVIDPGHGGQNSGTRSVADLSVEKTWTLDWALRLAPLLASNGWHVVLTRTNDVDVSLADRVALAETVKADLFISLHFNSGFPNTELTGAETFCLTPVGLPSTLRRDFEDDTTREFPNNAHDGANLRYAFRLHRAVLEATGTSDRGVRRARFMGVLRGQNRPAVLLEAGYLSNRDEAQLIATPAYRERLARAVARALTSPDLLASRPIQQGTSGLGAQ